jgi:hypothetical protein
LDVNRWGNGHPDTKTGDGCLIWKVLDTFAPSMLAITRTWPPQFSPLVAKTKAKPFVARHKDGLWAGVQV